MTSSLFRPIIFGYHRLVRMHPAERGRDLWFQEEARAERNSNFIRVVYVLTWLISTSLHAQGNTYWANMANLGVGGIWFVWSFGFQYWLMHQPYRSGYKYLSTTVDMVLITAMIFLYQFDCGPVFSLKVPSFFNYFCCIVLASLRFNRQLTVTAGALATGLYALVIVYIFHSYDIVLGSNIEHTMSSKVNFHYLVFQVIYLGVFTFMTWIVAVNVRRLVDLRAVESEMAHRAQERAAVAAGVAHEIKNPLEGIYGAAQLLQEEGKGNPRFIQMILKDSVRLNETVQQFLRFSRPFAAQLSRFDIITYVREFCAGQNEVAKRGAPNGVPGGKSPDKTLAEVEFITNQDSLILYSDEEGLRQILLNLVQNARRYQVPGEKVRVRAEVGDDIVVLRVEDDGKGVPEDQRNKLFEPFFTTAARGTGLGLAISRKIARELGGDLYFEPGHPGSHFVLVVRNHPGTETKTA